MDILWRDVTLAMRMLRKNLRFSVMVVVIIAVGIGAGATILSVVEEALIRGWPNSQRIFALRGFSPTKNVRWFRYSVPELNEARQIPGVFESVGAISGGPCVIVVNTVPEDRECTLISHQGCPCASPRRCWDAASPRPTTVAARPEPRSSAGDCGSSDSTAIGECWDDR